MALNDPYEVDCGRQFPAGLTMLGDVQQVKVFQKSVAVELRPQERDRDSGLPLWQVQVIDLDPKAWEHTFSVRIAAAVQPVPPPALPGMPVRPVFLEGLRVSMWTKTVGRDKEGKDIVKIQYGVTASGLSAPGRPANGDGSKASS